MGTRRSLGGKNRLVQLALGAGTAAAAAAAAAVAAAAETNLFHSVDLLNSKNRCFEERAKKRIALLIDGARTK